MKIVLNITKTILWECIPMDEFIEKLKNIEDIRQQVKVKHLLSDIVAIVIFATLSNAPS